jgi:hypothetical protein
VTYPAWDDIRNSTYTRLRNFPMIDADMPTLPGPALAISPADLRGADAVIIGAPYAAGWTTYAGVDRGLRRAIGRDARPTHASARPRRSGRRALRVTGRGSTW